MDILKHPMISNNELIQKENELRLLITRDAHPSIDLFSFFSGEFGARYTAHKYLTDRFLMDPLSNEVQEFYSMLVLKKEMFDTEDFYTRWTLITPQVIHPGKKYPLVIFCHGAFAPLEESEYCGFMEFQAEEEFFAVYPQNTNPSYIELIVKRLSECYPLDTERVYMGGYSAGGSKTIEAYVKIPQLLAAGGPCACGFTHFSEDITASTPPDRPYVPTIRIDSQYDPSLFIPLNKWVSRVTMLDYLGIPHPKPSAMPDGWDREKDPTFEMIPDGKGGFVSSKIRPGPKILPPEGITYDQWKVQQFNYRLSTLGCKRLDVERCMDFAHQPDDSTHHLFGIYGEKEHIEEHMGAKHHVLNYTNSDGINAMRYIAVENAPHSTTPMLPRLMWDFFKKFRRDSVTGQIIEETK